MFFDERFMQSALLMVLIISFGYGWTVGFPTRTLDACNIELTQLEKEVVNMQEMNAELQQIIDNQSASALVWKKTISSTFFLMLVALVVWRFPIKKDEPEAKK